MTKSLKIAATADLHLSDWALHSDIDQFGRPSRLTQYVQLALDFAHYAEKNKCDVAVIAGDILQQPLLKPMVLDVLHSVIKIITDKLPLIITFGQHDIDTKKPEISEFHSALSHLQGIKQENLYYVASPEIITLKGHTFYVQPWEPEAVIEVDEHADVFVGHGFVSGVTNHEGYVFNSGFKKDDLFKRFKVSIIGDIHNGVAVHSNGGHHNLILIPGAPIQNSYKDSPVCGFWCVTLLENKIPSYTFQSIHEIHENFYHRFLYTDDPKNKSTKLIHYKLKPKKKERNGNGKSTIDRVSTITEIIEKIIHEAKVDDKTLIQQLVLKELQTVISTDRSIPRTQILNANIHNFLSISDFELNLKEFDDSLVITGKNGFGKTSLFEAIYWALTGETTKKVSTSDIINDANEDGLVKVELLISVEDTPYKIVRSRSNGKPSLHVVAWNEEMEGSEIDRSSTGATQETIRKLIGLSNEEILLLCYFSAQNPTLFGNLGSTAKNNLMAMVSSTNEVEMLRKSFNDRLSETGKQRLTLSTKIDMRDREIASVKDRIQVYTKEKSKKRENDTELLDELKEKEAKLKSQLESIDESIEELEETRNSLSVKKSKLERESETLLASAQTRATVRDRTLNQILRIKTTMARTIENAKCPTCGHELEDSDDVLQSFADQVVELEGSVPDEESMNEDVAKSSALMREALDIEPVLEEIKSTIQFKRNVISDLGLVRHEITKLDMEHIDYDKLIETEMKRLPELVFENEVWSKEFKDLERQELAETWIYSKLLKRNGPLVTELNGQTKVMLQQEIDSLLEDSRIKVTIDDKLDIKAKFLDRPFKNYESLSTGQARVIDISMMVGLNNLFTQLYGLEGGVLGIIIFDEVLSFLDREYIDLAYNLLEMSRADKKLVITHNTELSSKFHNSIEVKLQKGRKSSEYTKSWS